MTILFYAVNQPAIRVQPSTTYIFLPVKTLPAIKFGAEQLIKCLFYLSVHTHLIQQRYHLGEADSNGFQQRHIIFMPGEKQKTTQLTIACTQ